MSKRKSIVQAAAELEKRDVPVKAEKSDDFKIKYSIRKTWPTWKMTGPFGVANQGGSKEHSVALCIMSTGEKIALNSNNGGRAEPIRTWGKSAKSEGFKERAIAHKRRLPLNSTVGTEQSFRKGSEIYNIIQGNNGCCDQYARGLASVYLTRGVDGGDAFFAKATVKDVLLASYDNTVRIGVDKKTVCLVK